MGSPEAELDLTETALHLNPPLRVFGLITAAHASGCVSLTCIEQSYIVGKESV